MKQYRINEIFYSLQGEGYWTGRPMVFLRFSGCNLRCPFCDTDFSSVSLMTGEEIVAGLKAADSPSDPCRTVCITGGEPSLQVDRELVDLLHAEGFCIHIETNGTRLLPEGIDWVTCSPKEDWQCGGRNVLQKADELKVVYEGQDVEKWIPMFPGTGNLFLQPCAEEGDEARTRENTRAAIRYVLSHPHWRLSLQTHKILDIK